jgi:RNA polymerase-interacting CarD/CdnL/TRCF family regulator
MNNDFKIGEKAVYPAHGVAEVIGIEKKEINTTVCSFYVLKVLATGMQILVPKEKADQVGLRPVATTSTSTSRPGTAAIAGSWRRSRRARCSTSPRSIATSIA